MPFYRHVSLRIFRIAAVFAAVVVTLSPIAHGVIHAASFNPEINYQGKLADNTGSAVDDGGYNMRFQLYTVDTAGSSVWTEVRCYSPDSGATCNGTGTDQRVEVANGLFSVLLGDITSLSAVDFNDELWLEVAIGATGTTPSWETLSPRKKLASVPSAFQADQLDGVDSLQFLRADEADTMTASTSATLLTIDQDGSGDIFNAIGDTTEYFSILSSGNVGVNNDNPGNQLSIGGDVGITTDGADFRFYQGSNYVGFQAPLSLSGDQIWILPDADATTSGQALVSDASGNLSWTTISGGASDYLSLSDTPGSFTASAIPFANTGGTALLHSSGLTFTDTNDILTVGSQDFYGYGTGNMFIGSGAGNVTLSGGNGYNLGLGDSTLSALTDGQYNIALGRSAGSAITSGDDNVALGYQAGLLVSTGASNVFVGNSAGRKSTGSYGTFIGHEAGRNNESATYNTFIGYRAGYSNNTSDSNGNDNTFIGAFAGNLNDTGRFNTFIGRGAAQTSVSASNIVAIGYLAGSSATSASNSVFIGNNAMRGGDGGTANVVVGQNAAYNLADSNNVILGTSAGYTGTTARRNVIIGDQAGYLNETGDANVFIGYHAARSETGSDKLYIENSDSSSPLIYGEFDNDLVTINGNLNVGGSNNELRFYEGVNYVGFEAPALSADQIWVLPEADATTSGQVLASDGAGTLFWTASAGGGGGASDYLSLSDTPGTFTTSAVPFTNTGGSALLHSSGFAFADTDDILTVGSSRIWDDGGTSVFIGQGAGNTSASGSNNVMIGQNGGSALTSGGNNVTLGSNAGSALTSGNNNVLLGHQAGNTLTTGGTNILIGYDVDVTVNSATNQLNIGNLIYGDLSANQLSVGTSTLSHTLAVAGTFDVNSGAINYATTTNITSIERLNLGNIEFEENAGSVSWFDLPVTSAAATGTVMSYVAQIDSNEILKLYSESDGSGGIDTTRVIIGSASSAVLGSSNIPDGSLIVADGALCVDDGGGANCDDAAMTAGQIYAESTSVTAIDLAENFPTKDPSLEAAELVMLDPSNPVFVKTYDPADPEAVLLGVVSTKPGVLLGGFGRERYKEEIQVPVALAGRVPIKVQISDTGAIQVGDRLTMSSTPGVATKAGPFSNTVGIALEPLSEDTEGVSEVVVFVNLQNAGPEGSGGVSGAGEQFRSLGVWFTEEVTRIARLIVGQLTVGTEENPSGITIYDTTTRQPYCIKIMNGQHLATPGACEVVDTSAFFESFEAATTTDGGVSSGEDVQSGDELAAGNDETPTTTDSGAGEETPTTTDSGIKEDDGEVGEENLSFDEDIEDETPTTTDSGISEETPTTTGSETEQESEVSQEEVSEENSLEEGHASSTES